VGGRRGWRPLWRGGGLHRFRHDCFAGTLFKPPFCKAPSVAQRIFNIYQIVTLPWFYEVIQRTLGTRAARARYVAKVLRPVENMKVLDCGCGTVSLLSFFHNSDHTGIVLNI
jgi:hypothetical protein